MVEKVSAELMERFRATLAQRGVTRDSAHLESYPVEAVRTDLVPFIGTVHARTKRVAKRVAIDEFFKKLKF